MTLLNGLPHNLLTVITLIVILSILVVAHEWGHFIIARLFGIRVDDFSIGFGKRLFRLGKRGDTEYNVRMLPLGGFVKIAGMEADEEPLIRAKEKITGRERDDRDAGEWPLIAENTAEATPYTAPDGFNSKPRWQRSLVILAGPVMSFVLGYVLFCLMGVTVGIPTDRTLNKVGVAMPGGEGQRIGLRIGDTIQRINGQLITNGQQMVTLIHANANKPVTLTIQRGQQTFTKVATPQPMKDEQGKPITFVDVADPKSLSRLGLRAGDTLGQIDGEEVTGADQAAALLRQDAGKHIAVAVQRENDAPTLTGTLPAEIGKEPNAALPTLTPHYVGLLEITPAREIKRVSLAESIRYGNTTVAETFASLAFLIHHRELHKAAGGIIFMTQATGLAVQSGLPDVVSLMASLSISLAIFNLLPIPILDGGHLLTFFIEWVRGGKKMTEQQQQAFMMTGLLIIGALFFAIMTNDILRTIKHQLPQ